MKKDTWTWSGYLSARGAEVDLHQAAACGLSDRVKDLVKGVGDR
jgi:hypothetical protein